VEGSVDLEGGEVVRHVEFVRRVSGVDDEVELELPVLCPAFLVGDDEVFRTELEGLLLFVGRMRDNVCFRA
jgi:hypothetical protein